MSGESPPRTQRRRRRRALGKRHHKVPITQRLDNQVEESTIPVGMDQELLLPDHRLGGERRLQSGARRGTQRLPDQTEEVKARRSRRWAEVRLSLAGEHEHVMVAIGDHIGGQVFSMARRAVFSTLLSLAAGVAAGGTSGAARGVTNGIPGNAVEVSRRL
jgi:hypothetical protein